MTVRVFLYFILVCFSVSTAHASDTWESSLSLWGSEHFGGGSCAKDHVPKTEANSATPGFCEACQNKDLKDRLGNLGKISEASFFDETAKEYIARNKCWEQKVESLDSTKKTAVANDIKTAMPEIVEAYKQLQKVQLDKSAYSRGNLQTENVANNKKIQGALAAYDQQIEEKTKTLNEKISGTWLGSGHFMARKAIVDFAENIANHPGKYKSPEYVTSFSVKNLEDDILNPMLASLRDEQASLLQKSDQGKVLVEASTDRKMKEQRSIVGAPSEGEIFFNGSLDKSEVNSLMKLDTKNLHFDLDDGDKIRLFKENGMGKALLGSTPDQFRKNLNLYCEMDGRYGKARSNFDAVESGLEFAGLLLLPAAPYVLAASGVISAEAAETVALLMRGGSSILSVKSAIQESCGSDVVANKMSNTCDSTALSAADFTKQISEHQCLARLAVTGIGVVPVAGKLGSSLVKASERGAAARFAAGGVATEEQVATSGGASAAEKAAAKAASERAAVQQAAAKEAEAKRIASVPSSKDMPALTGKYDYQAEKVTDVARFEREAHVFKAGSDQGYEVLSNLEDGTYPYLIDSDNDIAVVNRLMTPLEKDDPKQMLGHHEGLMKLLEKKKGRIPKITGAGEIVVRNGKVVQVITNKAGNARGGMDSLKHSNEVLKASGLSEPKDGLIDVSKDSGKIVSHTEEAKEAAREVEFNKDEKLKALWVRTQEVMTETMKRFPNNKAFYHAVFVQMQIDQKTSTVDSPMEKAIGYVGTFSEKWHKPQNGETFAIMRTITKPNGEMDPSRMEPVFEFMKRLQPPADAAAP